MTPTVPTKTRFRSSGHRAVATCVATALALTLLALPLRALAWWNPEWSYRKQITIAPPADLQAGIAQVPVLIRLHEGVLTFTEAAPDGADLRFVAEDDKTPLSFHIEKWDAVFNLAFVWVQLPQLAPGTPVNIFMYYGKAEAPTASEPPLTWDTAQTLVYHFAETDTPALDSTSYRNNATTPYAQEEGGLIGGGAKLDGQSTIRLPATQSLAIAAGGTQTLSMWFKPAAPAQSATLFSLRDGGASLAIGLQAGAPYVEVSGTDGVVARNEPASPIADTEWHHIAAVAEAERVTLYLDGNPLPPLETALPALAAAATLGGAEGGNGFSGEIDELQIAKVARTAAAIRIAALNQGPSDSMVQFGADEVQGGASSGYVGVILASVTFDGWVVIVICILMMVISWYVMWRKAIQVGRVSRSNKLFLDMFRASGGDFAVLEELTSRPHRAAGKSAPKPAATRAAEPARAAAARTPRAARGGTEGKAPRESSRGSLSSRERELVQRSPLLHMFRDGIRELHQRLHTDDSGVMSGHLTSQSIAAIRATIDSRLVQEIQSLSSLLVLLTIAISGGPFIGLLGTVVGVMITFAAVAAAGEVNVNAIAPGISAALAATVAGLMVAIPALFGYNYLITRNKECTAEMHVFVDAFVTRMAENYAPQHGD